MVYALSTGKFTSRLFQLLPRASVGIAGHRLGITGLVAGQHTGLPPQASVHNGVLQAGMQAPSVPKSLRTWFVVHFVIDVLVALPLFLFPHQVLGALGWQHVDITMTRGVAAALFGIGIESFLCRHDGATVFKTMLRLKVIWAGAAVVGILISIFQGAPPFAYVFLTVFLAFWVLWMRYLVRLR